MALLLLISGCRLLNTTSVGDTKTEKQTVELGSADEAKVQIRMNAGQLDVAGGADKLMQATFRYNVDDWQPRIDYSMNGNQGILLVDNSGDDIPVGGNMVNEWNLRLDNGIPIDLDIETGAGESQLDLRDLDLINLQVQTGAGTTQIDLSSVLDHDLQAGVEGGVGELSVILPGEMGVRVALDQGIGGLTNSGLVKDGDYYVNEAYGVSPSTLFLNISAGVGAIELLAP